MSETINLPQLGFDMREGTFLNWVKQVGETVKQGDVLAEIESDKATIEVPSPASGVLLQTMVNAGDVVAVGAPIAVMGAANEIASASPASATPASIDTGGNVANQAPPVATEQTESPAPSDTAAAVPATVAANGNGATRPANNVQAAAPATSAPLPSDNEDENLPDGVRASPIARKMAQERGIDLHNVHGSGPNGRIVRSDVEGYQAPAAQPAAPSVTPQTAQPMTQIAVQPAAQPAVRSTAQPSANPAPSGPGIEQIPLSRIRQRIAARMVESTQTVPHFYVTNEIDVAALMAFRKQINETLDEGHKVSVNDLIVKAVALTLHQFPNLNSHYYGDKIVRYEHINIGIAVALENGLINVVAKDADRTPISLLAAHNKAMIAAVRSGKVKPDDIDGSTFTVSNLGPYDVEHFIAIINPPEAGILAIGSAQQVPVVVNGEIKIGMRMKCTISVDHRVSDGAEGARFMQAFKALIESPMRLLL